jgi:hypothetical protein
MERFALSLIGSFARDDGIVDSLSMVALGRLLWGWEGDERKRETIERDARELARRLEQRGAVRRIPGPGGRGKGGGFVVVLEGPETRGATPRVWAPGTRGESALNPGGNGPKPGVQYPWVGRSSPT